MVIWTAGHPIIVPLFRETVASQYFLELAKYVGLPVIAWNADNAALEKAKDMVGAEQKTNSSDILKPALVFQSQSSVQLQLAPTLRHQAQAILALLQRWESANIKHL